MKKLSLLLLDANIVIKLHELGLWEKVVESCDLHIAGTVVIEADHWDDQNGMSHAIHLSKSVEAGTITKFDLAPSDVEAFKRKYGISFFEKLDAGEAESLAFLLREPAKYMISSGDAIVYRVLGAEFIRDQGISLEEILAKIGLQHNGLPKQYTKKFRVSCSEQGFIQELQGKAH